MGSAKKITTHSPEETESVARKLVPVLRANDIVALYGAFGAGKTCFVRGIAGGLKSGIAVKSPSFSIINEYPGDIPLFHIDFYRLEKEIDIESTGWDDCLDRGGIVVIEWAERVKNMLPKDRIDVYFHILDENTRELEIIEFDSSGNR